MRTFMAATLLATLSAHTWAQPAMSDFDPSAELSRIGNMPASYQRVRQLFYLGDLTSRSGHAGVARQAFRQAVVTFKGLEGNHRTLGVTYASHAALGLAGLTHLEFRDVPLSWESYASDSAQRWELQRRARGGKAAADVGYARATFEALYLRARILEEWDIGELDTVAEAESGIDGLARIIRHLSLAVQLTDQAEREDEHMLALADSLGLAGGGGDEDVEEWADTARERLAQVAEVRANMAGREEALQALFLERTASEWLDRAVPLLWERGAMLAEQDARVADPYVDFILAQTLADEAFRPFVYGPGGFHTLHKAAVAKARSVRSEAWLSERLRWERELDWLDSGISRRVARDALEQLARAPAMLDTALQKIIAAADTLPDDWASAIGGVPETPTVEMPAIPNFGDWDPQWRQVEDEDVELAQMDRYIMFREQMQEVVDRISSYRARVVDYTALAGRLTSLASKVSDGAELPPAVEAYGRLRRGIGATQMVLLDTLRLAVARQSRRALAQSRAAAVWLPAGAQSFAVQQAIDDYVAATVSRMQAIAQQAREEAKRHRREARNRAATPPAAEIEAVADALDAFAARIDETAAGFRSSSGPIVSGS